MHHSKVVSLVVVALCWAAVQAAALPAAAAVPPDPRQLRSLAQAAAAAAPAVESSPGAPQPALQPEVIRPDQVYYPAKGVVAAPSTAIAAPQLNVSAANAATIEACAELCSQAAGCDWFWYCSTPGGCQDGSGGSLPFQQCRLLGEACSLPARGLTSSTAVQVTSGFPTTSAYGEQVFKFTELQGQGIEGADLPCAPSIVPGKCALSNVDEAMMVCHAMGGLCKAVTIYFHGLDGCSSSPVAVLKTAAPYPDNSWVSPHVSTLINFEPPDSYPFFLYESEAAVQVPTEAELAANDASLAANGTAWWGCASGQCVASGADVAVLDNVASPEACCRACAARLGGTPAAAEGQACNVWNWCGARDGCSFAGASISPAPVRLEYQQCQLRYAFLANITYGSPLIVAAKGSASEFSCGAPLSFWAPELPGFAKLPGRGVFLSGTYNCTASVRPKWDCSPPSTNLTELAQGCLDDPQCRSMPIKQGLPPVFGAYNLSSRYRGFRKTEASASNFVIVPTTNLYLAQGKGGSSSGGGSSSSGLSPGAIAGIAVGAAAGAALLAGMAWAVVRWRRQRLATAAAAEDAALESGKGSPLACKPDSTSSSSASPSQSSSQALAQGSPRTPCAGERGPLAELLERVASVEAAAATNLGTGPMPSEHALLSAESLPARLREVLVPPSAVTYCHWPNGQPQEIGAGATSRVYKAMLNGEAVAAKEIDLSCSQIKQEAFITEALRLQQLRHPNVVSLMGIALAPSKGVLLLELCAGRDLHAALDVLARGTQDRLFGWHRRGKRIALEVAKALNFLHSKGIVHLDVKSPNVLLTGNGTAKLADVGFSREKLHTFLSDVSNVGTFAWAAPELLLRRKCTMAVDSWSFGVLLWEIVTGERPWRGQLRRPRVPQECPQAVSDLVFECLHQDPAKRPTALQLLQRLGPLVDPPSLPAQPAPGGSSTGSGSGSSGGSGSGESPAPPYQPQAANAEPQAGPSATPGTTEAHSPASQRQWQLPSPFVAHAGVALPRQQQQQQ